MERTVIRAARAADAAQIALVHVRSWQSAYRGLMPQAYLDGLDPAQRVGRWELVLAEAEAEAEAGAGAGGKVGDGAEVGTGAGAGRTGVLVADVRGTLLGFASYSPSRDDDADQRQVGEIGAIYLLPGAWSQGIGRRLMDAALACLAEVGFSQATLWVLDSNARARRFYEAGGWSADGAREVDESRGFLLAQMRYRRSLLSSAL
jgi:GNAT superfamily N-acetyltransferase